MGIRLHLVVQFDSIGFLVNEMFSCTLLTVLSLQHFFFQVLFEQLTNIAYSVLKSTYGLE